jgi:hypothetical protein
MKLKESVGAEEWPVGIVTALCIMLEAIKLRNTVCFDRLTLRLIATYI